MLIRTRRCLRGMRPAPRAEIRPTTAPWLSNASRLGVSGFEFEFRFRRAACQPFSRASPGCETLQPLKTRLPAAAHADQAQLRGRLDARLEVIEQPLHPGAIIADWPYITPRRQCATGTRRQIPDGCRSRHGQIVREHQAAELQPVTQLLGNPALREARRYG